MIVSRRRRAPRVAALPVALLAVIAIAAPATAQEPRANLPEIEREVMCPICGTPLEHSAAPQAERQRELIRRLIAEGQTKEEIKDALVDEYGPQVLAVPRASGFDLTAWVLPGVGFGLAGLIIGGFLLGRSRRRDEPDGGSPPQGEDADRLDEDMARYDL